MRFLECTLILERLKNDCASEIDKDLQELPQLKDSEGKSMTASNLSGQSYKQVLLIMGYLHQSENNLRAAIRKRELN